MWLEGGMKEEKGEEGERVERQGDWEGYSGGR